MRPVDPEAPKDDARSPGAAPTPDTAREPTAAHEPAPEAGLLPVIRARLAAATGAVPLVEAPDAAAETEPSTSAQPTLAAAPAREDGPEEILPPVLASASAASRPPQTAQLPRTPAQAPAHPSTPDVVVPEEGVPTPPEPVVQDAPLTEPSPSEPVPTSVLAPSEGEAPSAGEAAEAVPDVVVPDPLVPHGPEEPRSRRRRRRGRQEHRAVFAEALPTQALVLVDRLQASPYGKRMRSTLQQRKDSERAALEARTTLDFALKLGETMFSFGATSLDVETSIIVVTQAYGIHETEVDLTNQAISLNYAPDSSRGDVPYTLQRVVRSYSTDFDGLVAVHRLVEQISDGAIERAEAQRRLVEIRRRPKPYPPWLQVLLAGVFVACFIPFIGGTWQGAVVGMASTWLVFWLKELALAPLVQEIYATLAGAFAATVIALGAYALHLPVNPAIVVAGGIMMLLPTSRFVTAVQDAINGFPVTAAGRFISAMLVFFGIMGGVSLAVGLADLLAIARLDLAASESTDYPTALLLVLIVVATGCGAVVERAGWVTVLASCAVTTAAFLVYAGVGGLGLSAQLVPAVAASVAGFVGRVVALRVGAPPIVVVVPSILFLLPGLTVFRSLYEFTVETSSTMLGLAGIVNALVIIVAIGAGAVFGDTLARPITERFVPARTPGPEGHQR